MTLKNYFYKTNMADVILFTSIFLFSTFSYCVTVILKINFLILKLQLKINALKNLVGLLDQQIKSNILQEVNSNMVLAGVIFLAVGVTIAILFFFLSGGGGSGPGSDTSSIGDSFSSKSSEGSISKSSSNIDLRDTYTANSSVSTNITNNSLSSITEGNVMESQVQMLHEEKLQISLKETFDRMEELLLPNVSKWLASSTEQNLSSNSINFNLGGKSIKSWLQNIDDTFDILTLEGGLSTKNLQDLESTINSMDENLTKFLVQTQKFVTGSNLNTVKTLDPDLAGQFEFVFNAREVANELLQKLVEHEAVLKEMLPGTIIVPEWFTGILAFFLMMSFVCSQQMKDLHIHINDLIKFLKSTTPTNLSDVTYKQILIDRLQSWFYYLFYFIDGSTVCEYNGAGEFLRVNESNSENLDVFFNLLKELVEHHRCLNIDPIHITLFLG